MPLGQRRTAWPPRCVARQTSWYARLVGRHNFLVVEACVRELLRILDWPGALRPYNRSRPLNITFYTNMNFLASRARLRQYSHRAYRALAERLPGFGICFGHQLLAMHLGASVRTDESRMESGTVEVQGVQEDPVFARVGSRFHVHTGHTDLVESVPDGCRLLASTGRVPVQALRMDTAPWWTAQFLSLIHI